MGAGVKTAKHYSDYLQRARLDAALEEISSGAAERDARPHFPNEPLRILARTGVLGLSAPEPVRDEYPDAKRATFEEEWRVLRAVSGADGSVGRLLDGHLNATERVAALAPEPLRSEELEGLSSGELLGGVWGADPIPGEGEPARLIEKGNGFSVEGVKTFCSGASGLDRALILARDEKGKGPPLLVYLSLSEGIEVDRSWFRGYGMRSSESHRVIFHDTPVLAVLGEPGELLTEPYFSRDAIRTAACWAGIADRAVDSAIETLAAKSGGEPDDVISLAAGKILSAQATIDRWFEHASGLADSAPEVSLSHISTHLRQSVAAACREILDEAARACGSRPFAVADALDRARRDLEIFLLQHRLEPALVRAGGDAIRERRG